MCLSPTYHLHSLSDGQFDVVLSSDTLYSLEYFESLLLLLKKTMRPGGCAYFASKRYYFGVGGGVNGFVLMAREAGFSVENVRVFENGGSNIRDILRIKF